MNEHEQSTYKQGDMVQFEVRTGKYVGELIELNGPRALVKVLAVMKHPEQGDLHQPYEPDTPMFHERRALSYMEKTNVLLRGIQPFRSTVPDYNLSLRAAVAADIEALDKLMRWSAKSLELMKQLQHDYKLN